jgi:hypothetical protein
VRIFSHPFRRRFGLLRTLFCGHRRAHGGIRIWVQPGRQAQLLDFAARPLVLISLRIGMGFAWFGAWMILPFVGLEMLASNQRQWLAAQLRHSLPNQTKPQS